MEKKNECKSEKFGWQVERCVARALWKGRRGFVFRGRIIVEIEHILAKILEQDDTDLHKIAALILRSISTG